MKRYIIEKIDNEYAMILDINPDGEIVNEYKIKLNISEVPKHFFYKEFFLPNEPMDYYYLIRNSDEEWFNKIWKRICMPEVHRYWAVFHEKGGQEPKFQYTIRFEDIEDPNQSICGHTANIIQKNSKLEKYTWRNHPNDDGTLYLCRISKQQFNQLNEMRKWLNELMVKVSLEKIKYEEIIKEITYPTYDL